MSDADIAVYSRVSSRQQDHASQETDLKKWAENQEGSVIWFRDKFTGNSMDRPGWNRVWTQIESGNIRTLTIWRLDRLGRTARGLTALFEELAKHKVNLISLRDGLDLSTPSGRLMAHVLASVAEYETEIRAERTLAGQAVARSKGVKFGRPPGPGKRLKVTTEQVAVIHRLKAEGESVSAIARTTGLSRPTVYSVLGAAGRECTTQPASLD